MSTKMRFLSLFTSAILFIVAAYTIVLNYHHHRFSTDTGTVIEIQDRELVISSHDDFALKADDHEEFAILIDGIAEAQEAKESEKPWGGYKHNEYWILTPVTVPAGDDIKVEVVKGGNVYLTVESSDNDLAVKYNIRSDVDVALDGVVVFALGTALWLVLGSIISLLERESAEFELVRLWRWFKKLWQKKEKKKRGYL